MIQSVAILQSGFLGQQTSVLKIFFKFQLKFKTGANSPPWPEDCGELNTSSLTAAAQHRRWTHREISRFVWYRVNPVHARPIHQSQSFVCDWSGIDQAWSKTAVVRGARTKGFKFRKFAPCRHKWNGPGHGDGITWSKLTTHTSQESTAFRECQEANRWGADSFWARKVG